MSECAYYFKAAFPSVKAAKTAAEELQKFFLEAMDANDFIHEFSGICTHAKKFWGILDKKYPRVSEYLKVVGLWKNKSMDLPLDFGSDRDNEVYVSGAEIGWGDGSVWHFADWSPLCEFVKKKYGATKAVWDNEENGCGSLDSLNLYDWGAIVQNLLKNKTLWPMLLHVHPDLTALLEARMKRS